MYFRHGRNMAYSLLERKRRNAVFSMSGNEICQCLSKWLASKLIFLWQYRRHPFGTLLRQCSFDNAQDGSGQAAVTTG